MRRRKRKRRGEENGLDLRLRPLSSSPFLAASENDITTKMAAIFHLSSVRVVVNAFFTSFFSFTFPPQTSWSFSMAFLFDSVSRDRSPVQYRRVVFPIFSPTKSFISGPYRVILRYFFFSFFFFYRVFDRTATSCCAQERTTRTSISVAVNTSCFLSGSPFIGPIHQ